MLESKRLPREMIFPLNQKGGGSTDFNLTRPNQWTPWKEVYSYIRPGKKVKVTLTVIRTAPVFGKIRYFDVSGNRRIENIEADIPLFLELGRRKGGGPTRVPIHATLKTNILALPGIVWNFPRAKIIVRELN